MSSIPAELTTTARLPSPRCRQSRLGNSTLYAMDCSSPGDEDFSVRGEIGQPGRGSRLITVVSREDLSPPESPPFARSWEAASRQQTRVPRQYSRSRSMTDMLRGQRKSPGLYSHRKHDSRVLPSCRANPSRRSPLSGKSSGSTTLDLVRKDSDSSLSRHSLDFERSQSASTVTSTKTHKRNKSDSGIVLDGHLPRASLSAGGRSLKLGLSHRGSVADSLRTDQSVSDAKNLSQFDSVEDGSCVYNFGDRTFGPFDQPRGRRQRNYSESELTDSLSQSFDAEDSLFSLSGKPKHLPLHRSLESLSWKDTSNVFPEFLPGSLGAPEMDLGSQEWGPALQSSSRTDSLEHMNYAGSRLGSGSVDDDDDNLNVSWSSSGWRKSVRARSTCSSEDSTEDVFLSAADSVGEVLEASHVYLRSKSLNSNSDSEISPLNHQNTPTSTQKSKRLTLSATNTSFNSDPQEHHLSTSSRRSRTNPSSGVAGSDAQSRADSGQRFTKTSETAMNCDSKDLNVTTRNHQVTHSQEKDQSLSSSASDEHLDVYEMSRSSSVLLPHLQKTLEAVRQHIKSKKTSPASKIPVRVRQQISPRRHRSQSGSRNPRRKNSVESSANGVPSEQVPSADPVSCGAGVVSGSPASSIQGNASLEESVADSRRQSQDLVPTAVTLRESQDETSSSSISRTRKDNSGWTSGFIGSVRVSDDRSAVVGDDRLSVVGDDRLSVFSPHPPRTRVKASDTTPPTTNADQCYSSLVKVESLSDTNSDTSQRKVEPSAEKSGPSPTKLESSPRKHESSPRKHESSPRKTESSPRNGVVSPRSRSGENSPRKYRRKTVSRVEYLLSNDLFQKHLSGHIDLVEKNIFHMKKFGLRKSFSNLDLTVTDSEKLQVAFESSLKLQDTDLDRSVQDESDNRNERKPLHREDILSASSSLSTSSEQSVKNTATDPSQTPRRKSIACDDQSLHQLQEVLEQNKRFPATVFSATRRGRVHIPSFDEFRKQRQTAGGDTGRVSHASSAGSDSSKASADDPDGLAMNHRLLDTIKEDDGMETARSLVCVSLEPSVSRETVEYCGEGMDKDGPKDAVSVETSTLRVSKHGNGQSAMREDTSRESVNAHEAKDRSNQPSVAKSDNFSTPVSSERQTAPPKTNSSVEYKPSAAGQSGERKFTSKLASLRNNKRTGTSSTTTERLPNRRTAMDTYYKTEKRQKSFELNWDGRGPPAKRCSSSPGAAVPGDVWDGETVPEDGCGDDKLIKRALEEDFPYRLFDEQAVSMDTESWARLFTQVRRLMCVCVCVCVFVC